MSIMEHELFAMCEKLTNKLHEYCNCHPTHDTEFCFQSILKPSTTS
jgi:hypothetical protein